MAADFLTTRELIELLKVDRITIYRMLGDGRLKGVKVGMQWRFAREEIDRLLGTEVQIEEKIEIGKDLGDFPVTCVQNIIDIFAGIQEISAVLINLRGHVLTRISHPTSFCRMMLSSKTGQEACLTSWQNLASPVRGLHGFRTCHAGLSYLRANILLNQKTVAWLILGQYFLAKTQHPQGKEWIEKLAQDYQLPVEPLFHASTHIPVLNTGNQKILLAWAPKVSKAISSILEERSDLVDRLNRIAQISTLQPLMPKCS